MEVSETKLRPADVLSKRERLVPYSKLPAKPVVLYGLFAFFKRDSQFNNTVRQTVPTKG